MPTFTMRQLLEAGVHFGHNTHRWNPKNRHFIFGVRNGIHVIDLQKTVPMMGEALEVVKAASAKGGRVLFVGTKRQAQDKVKEAAMRCGQYYVNHRWLGGMLTNWKTISKSIARLKELDRILSSEEQLNSRAKKEIIMLTRERDKLELSIGGIKDMGGQPDVVFVIDCKKEAIAILEANKLGIPVIGIVDTNVSAAGVDYPIPGNDDAARAIDLYCELVSGAVLEGIQAELTASGADLGEAVDVKVNLPKEEAANAEVSEEKAKAKASA
jgi:small subunit ribosomal protein S2